ncbi:MAG: leucine--tRNA ligase [Minisyncoccia bacterium]|jgi:leucyl-tRNA synthetase
MTKYDHKKIEKKWQKKWEDSGTYKTAEGSDKQKFYVLDMFPYPSGVGLHVGHVEGYTATDVYSRYKRAKGFNVLHPMGWDAFGLPAENYAIKTGTPPQKTTDESINTFRKQIKNLGLSYDWTREFGTHSPEYYRWTQWLFTKFFERGLVYKKKALVNWDPVDQTVLANEQVLPDGTAERSGAKVEKKELEQWFYKITDYADELVDGLSQVDWPESTKINQRNWIGRSEGAEIDFAILQGSTLAQGSQGRTFNSIKVFTTRPDTLFGATYLVLAPEHPLLGDLLEQLENKEEVLRYIEVTKVKSDIERNAEGKEKTGVELKGIKAINPANKEEIPIYIADYVLEGYGTGAIMAVPAHDERDNKFAKKFHLPIIEAELADAKKIVNEVGGTWVKKYRLRDWLISRQRYWGAPIPIVYDPEGKPHAVPDEHLPWLLPTDVEYLPKGTSPLGTSKELFMRTETIFGKGWKPEIDTMDTFACSSWYFFRFADPHNIKEFASKEALQKWLPVDLYVGGAEHTVLHLLYARFYTKALRDMGYLTFGEPFLTLRHQGIILAEDSRKMSKRWNNVINPDDMAERFGADSVRLYEMFMGPLEAMKPWNTNNIMGVRRFLERVWKLSQKIKESSDVPNQDIDLLLNQSIKKIADDIENLKLNTAVSKLMTLLNFIEKEEHVGSKQWNSFLQLLAPFAPHIASELAEQLEFTIDSWPEFDPQKTSVSMATIAVQINGKVRGRVELATNVPDEEALAAARANPQVAAWLKKGKETKAIYVPGRIINFVVVEN